MQNKRESERDGRNRSRSKRIKLCPAFLCCVSQPSYIVFALLSMGSMSSYIIHVNASTHTHTYLYLRNRLSRRIQCEQCEKSKEKQPNKKENSLWTAHKKTTACTHTHTQWINNKSTTTATNFFLNKKKSLAHTTIHPNKSHRNAPKQIQYW